MPETNDELDSEPYSPAARTGVFWDRSDVSSSSLFSILVYLAEATEPLSITELSRRSGIHRATLHRNLESLVNEGWLIRGGRPIRYRLSLRLGQVGLWTLRQNRVREALLPHAMALCVAIQKSTSLAFYEEGSVVFTDSIHLVDGTAVPSPFGNRVPAHTAGPGKMLLAALPAEERARLLAGTLLALTPRTKSDPEELAADLRICRERGYGWSFNEFSESTGGSVGYAVFDHSRHVVACLTQWIRAEDEPSEAEIEAGLAAAARASSQLGFRGLASP